LKSVRYFFIANYIGHLIFTPMLKESRPGGQRRDGKGVLRHGRACPLGSPRRAASGYIYQNNCDWQNKNRIHQATGPVFGHRKQGDTPLHPYAENTHSQAVNGRLVETSRPYHENYMRESLLNT